MAVSAYQALISLSNLLDKVYDRIQIQFPRLDAKPFDPVREGVNFILNILEAYSQRKSQKLDGLWRQIAEVSHEADDIIDAHVVDQLRKESGMEEIFMEHSTFYEDMERVKQKFEVIKKELLIAIEGGEDIVAVRSTHASSSATSSHGKDIVVGLDEKARKVMDELTNTEADLRINTITGMGGIGKTTLAKKVYDSPLIVERFVVRLWVVISQEYVIEKVLQGLLDSGEKRFFSDLEDSGEKRESGESFSVLGEKLHKGLFGRRYLVVLDDVWSPRVWDDLKRFFPDYRNGSRIMMTTRDSSVASSLSSGPNPCRMNFLDCNQSWDLLRQKVFSHGDCPNPELEEVGKNIARDCKGLPLSIVVIGSMLASSEMTREYWELVAKDVNSFRDSGDDGHCLQVLSLSYNCLPIHLKSCLLYMRRYHEDEVILVVSVTRQLAAEGLIKHVKGKDLESEAKEYLNTLVARNLIFIRQYRYDASIWKCGVHDLVRDLVCRESAKENLICSPKVQDIEKKWEEKICFLCGSTCGNKQELNFLGLVHIPSSSSQGSPFMCNECEIKYQHIKRLSVVKVMDSVGEYFSQNLVHVTKMQYIRVLIPGDLKLISPSTTHLLWRLESLVIKTSDSTTPIVLPSEIWKIPQLTVLGVERAILTYPEGKDSIILKHLRTLWDIRNFICTPQVVYRIPNLKELHIVDRDDSHVNDSICNLAILHKLEILTIDKPIYSLENISFPDTLKILYLMYTRIPWKDVTIIGSLPNLDVLTMDNACIGPEWNPAEGEFLRLQGLIIGSTDLLHWTVGKIHFPKLEMLKLRDMHQLEIPSDIGDIPTLERINLERCSQYVINSAKKILEEQKEYGNYGLLVVVTNRDGTVDKFGGER